MKKQPKTTMKTPDLSGLDAAELRLLVAQFQAVVEEQNTSLLEQNARLENQKNGLFAIGRKNWLFADTRKGAEASAACYSLIETAKANSLDPHAYIKHILDHIAVADTLEKLETLLPWNVELG